MQQLRYDKCTVKTVAGEQIHYGIVYGNEKIVLIKTGAGGNLKGYRNKYPRIAHRLHERLGATVICATNPDLDHAQQVPEDSAMIAAVAAECGFSQYEVLLLGTSDGAYYNLVLAEAVSRTVKWLGINTSPKLCGGRSDLADLENRLQKLPRIPKTLVYGTKDDAFDCAAYLQTAHLNNVSVKTVPGADHEFTSMLDEFVALTDLL